MNRPTICVCIATYNQRDFIETCIRSVVEQEVDAALRIVVGDDASNDGTSEIVAGLAARYPDQVQHLRRESRLGAFANMRDLIERADGDFVARVDGDDYWLPGKLARQLAFLQSHPDCAAVYTNAFAVDEADKRIGSFNDVGDASFDLAAMLRRGNFLNNSSVLFRAPGRHAWLDVLCPQIDYRAHLWHARHGWLGHMGEPLAAYRVNTRGSMVVGMNDHVRELYWEAIQSVPRELVSDGDYARGVADFLRRVFFRAVRTRQPQLFRAWRKRAIGASPWGALRMDALTLASIGRITAKEIAGYFRRGTDGRRLRILYRR
jgi:glycosyltransferase involved in cell wall biosynthesis